MEKHHRLPIGLVLAVLAQLFLAPSALAYSWVTEFADSQGDVGYITGIALDASTVHIIYSDSGKVAIRYAKKTSAGWTTEEVLKTGTASALALDAAGNPHISYTFTSGTTTTLGYASKTGNAPWTYSTIESSSQVLIRDSAIALGTNGSVHISYRAGQRLKYATKNSGPWTTSVVDGGPPLNKNVGSYSSIALDANSSPRISYYNLTDKTLMYAEWLGTTWLKDTADFGGDTGWYTSLALDARGFPHISYYDSLHNKVKYITWDASGRGYWIQNAAGRGEVVDTVGVGAQTAIVLNSQNVPAIAYQGGTLPNFELRYAARTGTGQNKWVSEVVDTGGAGVGVSMQQIADGNPHISYSHLVPGSSPASKLKHAYPALIPIYVIWILIPLLFAVLIIVGMRMKSRKKNRKKGRKKR